MTIVFKLGGSLLTLPGLADKIRSVVEQRPGKNCLFVVGGGTTADVVRDWSRVHQLDDETSHWLAISSLDLNRQFLESLLKWRSVISPDEASRNWAIDSRQLLLDVGRHLRIEEKDGSSRLPHHWDVTSDSISAWVALSWHAEELVLLKSISAPHGSTLTDASHRGFVDPFFPQLGCRFERISWCDMRASTIAIENWDLHSIIETK